MARSKDALPEEKQLSKALREKFGFTRLRPGQREVIEKVLRGEDVLAIMPTGAGKSLCYQLPSLALPGQTVVVSPLIALMRDQAGKLDDAGIEAAQLNSTLSTEEEAEALRQVRRQSEIVFTTPERLSQDEFVATLKRNHIDLLVIDEAHCISQWGHDFRPAFLEIGRAAAALGDPPVLALTATATAEVVEDIRAQLGRPGMQVINTGIYRDNLDYSVRLVATDQDKRRSLLEVVNDRAGSGIVYTATVKAATEAHAVLREAGIDAALYHGRLGKNERHASQDRFMSGKARVMVATNAFGMGIDKPDIRFVAHYQVPASLEAYYQESGRAGRDGERAEGVLLFDPRDRRVQQFFMARRYPDAADLQHVHAALSERGVQPASLEELREAMPGRAMTIGRLRVALHLLEEHELLIRVGEGYRLAEDAPREALPAIASEYEQRAQADRDKLERMMFYAQTGLCRWQVLLDYFGEASRAPRCGHCDNCRLVREAEAQVPEPVDQADEPASADRTPAFEAGASVQVPKYGEGRVLEAVEGEVTIEFPDGTSRRFVEAMVRPAPS